MWNQAWPDGSFPRAWVSPEILFSGQRQPLNVTALPALHLEEQTDQISLTLGPGSGYVAGAQYTCRDPCTAGEITEQQSRYKTVTFVLPVANPSSMNGF